jgi:FtsP/CotA-like multicopper oxidase with cupredoxin domain
MSALAPTELDLRSPPPPPTVVKEAPGLLNRPIPAAAKFGALVTLVLGSIVALVALIAVLPRDAKPAGPTVRTYHIAVEEVQWRYAPSGYDNCTGVLAAESDHASIFTVPNATKGLIGDTYWRRRYVGYAPDGTFSVPLAAGWWPHAGIQGPTLRAGVGEVLRVRLLNRGRFPASLHVHGVPLITASRGEVAAAPAAAGAAAPGLLDAALSFFTGAAPTRGAVTVLSAPDTPNDPFSSGGRSSVCEGDGCSELGAASLLVEPDGVMEFSWAITEEAGPDGAAGSVGRLYSELTYDGHVDAGLAGVLVVTPAGANAAAPPADAPGGEVLALFSVSMESDSPYLPLNVLDFVWRARVAEALAATPSAAAAAAAAARHASKPSSPILPVPVTTSPAALLAALLNAAAENTPAPASSSGGHSHGHNHRRRASAVSFNATHPAILSALGAAAGGLSTGQTLTLPTQLLGYSLGATLIEGSLVGASSFYLLNATAFAAAHSQRALEGVVAEFANEALETERKEQDELAGNTEAEDEFSESNTMHGLNGLLFCNAAALPNAALPTAVLGATTRWYVAVLGTEVDLHAAHWHGNTVLERESAGGGAFRSDSIALLPRQIATADMVAHAAGRWLFHCHVTDHIEAGMLAVYDAVPRAGANASAWLPVHLEGSAAADTVSQPPPAFAAELSGGRIREYFIQAEVGNWSYLTGPAGALPDAPESAADGAEPCGTLDYARLNDEHKGKFTYTKARFVRYTDNSFTTRWVPPTADEAARWAHLALLGPLLRGEVGDTLRVTFRNAAPVPFSLHPHGVVYPKGGEGAPYEDATVDARDKGDDKVEPNQMWTYTWFLPEASGPGPGDPSSIPWLYHGHVHESKDENTGLVGVLLVTGRGKARVPGSAVEANLRPADVDRELVVMAKVFSEGAASEGVHEHGGRKPESAPNTTDAHSLDYFTLNGLLGCRLNLNATAGERVRLYGVSLGNEIDLHTLGASGHALTFRGRRQEGLSLIPGTMYAADTVAAGGGGWLLGSSVIHHAERGMVARLTVAGGAPAAGAPSPAAGGALREYWVAAKEVEWDYAPAGKDLCVSDEFKAAAEDLFPHTEEVSADGTNLEGFSGSVRTFVTRGDAFIGRRYRKWRYLGFSDGTYRAPLANAYNSSTGLLGPAMRAAPGDVLRVVLRNNLTHDVNLAFPSAPLLLVQLRERAVGAASWGAAVAGSPAELAARPVAPGWEAEASWSVPAAAGPGPADPPTIAWSYSSSIHPDHLYAGLAGGLIVGASSAALAPGGAAHGAAREYVLAWFIANENRSPLLDDNIQRYAGVPSSVNKTDGDFDESNLKHAVSGRLACNLGNLVAKRGERVRFHLLGLGSELDMHTPQAHGNMVRVNAGARASHVAALGVHPGTRATVELVARTGGQWLLECGVNDHWAAGMRAMLSVAEPDALPVGAYYESSGWDYGLSF